MSMDPSESNDKIFHFTKNSLQKSKKSLGFLYYVLFSKLSGSPKYSGAVQYVIDAG